MSTNWELVPFRTRMCPIKRPAGHLARLQEEGQVAFIPQVEWVQMSLQLLLQVHLPIWAKLAPIVVRGRFLLSYTTSPNKHLTNELALADADPLGVNQNVTFDQVGGLDNRASVICLLG